MTTPSKLNLSVTLIAFNEENNIGRALKSVAFAREVIVVDSGSTDRTVEIAKKFGAQVHQKEWLGFGPQKNYAAQFATSEWILNLDCDEEVSPELEKEITEALLSSKAEFDGFEFPRKTWYLGRWILHSGWYPGYIIRLCRKGAGHWSEPEIHEILQIKENKLGRLQADLLHYPFAKMENQITKNIRYAKLGSEKLANRPWPSSALKALFKAHWKFFEVYFLKAGFLDGGAGLMIAVHSAYSTFMKYSFDWERHVKK